MKALESKHIALARPCLKLSLHRSFLYIFYSSSVIVQVFTSSPPLLFPYACYPSNIVTIHCHLLIWHILKSLYAMTIQLIRIDIYMASLIRIHSFLPTWHKRQPVIITYQNTLANVMINNSQPNGGGRSAARISTLNYDIALLRHLNNAPTVVWSSQIKEIAAEKLNHFNSCFRSLAVH